MKIITHWNQCTNYMKFSEKRLKSLRIAQKMLSFYFSDYKFIYCECFFPRHDTKFYLIQRFKVNIVFEHSMLHKKTIYFTFITN